MYRDSAPENFSTLEVNVFDGAQLIACGFFDTGKNAAAGITSFYHPGYKKYSLGKFLIYSKIKYCRENGMKYFYPGYFVPGYTPFDYKLTIASRHLYYLEYKSQKWKHIDTFDAATAPLAVLTSKLESLKQVFVEWAIDVRLLTYDFFDANLIPGLQGIQLFDVPVFIYPLDVEDELMQPVIIFDIREQKYHLLKCMSVWKSNYPKNNDTYSAHLLKIDSNLFSTADAEEMVAVFVSAISSRMSDSFPGIQPNQT
jgi:leucyl-tRNA---protein transferase